ncbi:nitroreductase [Maribius pontilimi]|uniref:Nitroreductase n=1 Tax=Palleronia pontilimi TaxID=1964209 RepID=A0A934MBB1_9RHOB|nr:nitroreductase [Palleronia pontilimi]MBJ3761325.1 nitroreductase [Palleronia pontilimi]
MTDLERLLARRRSVRGYLDRPVARTDVEAILTAARTAPSGANLQPGTFHAMTGAPLDELRQTLARALDEGRAQVSEYDWFPADMTPDLKAKQRAAGFALYDALGIAKRNLTGRRAQFARNYRFFDAPVGIVVTIRRDMGKGAFMDLGMALMALMLAAEARGLASSGIGALANYADLVADALGLPDDEMVVCGVALGHADPDAPENAVRTERDPLDAFASFRGWDQ